MESIPAMGDFIGGRFLLSGRPEAVLDRASPADLSDRPGAFPVDPSHVPMAVEAARRAQPGWSALPLTERIAAMKRLRAAIEARETQLVEAIAREIGKPLWEARSEVRALLSKIDITIDEGLPLVAGFTRDGGRLETRFRPHGVLAVIGPFNFPLHLAHGHVVPALVTGNAVVFKPSDVAPASAQAYAQCFADADLPPGVFNLVQGRGVEGALLAAHDDVDGVLFTGSYETGVRLLAANAHRPGRMMALELGGKNAAVVLDDAPIEKAVHDVLYSALATAGQRCTAVSRVIVTDGIAERFIERLLECVPAFRCGAPWDAGSFHGPLATSAALEKFEDAQEQARREGHETLLASTRPSLDKRGHYVTPAIHRVSAERAGGRYDTEEIFGPDLAVHVVRDLDEACDRANATPFGLAAAVFTFREPSFDACAERLRVGCVGWNSPTVGSSSRLPFGGVKNSGNHRPAALFSTLYCAWPQAITRGAGTLDVATLGPAVHWPR